MNITNIFSKSNENNSEKTYPAFQESQIKHDIQPPSDRVDEYMQVLHDLAFEKDNLTLSDYEKKTERAFQRALAIINITGDDSYKEDTLNRLQKICQLKPGRKLFKALSSSDCKITIGAGDEFFYTRPGGSTSGYIHMARLDNFIGTKYDINDRFYNTYNKRFSSKPDFVGLAHELIHFVHYLTGFSTLFTKYLKNMDELEEQHTILGYNHILFAKNAPLSQIDVLSETAFLLALNKPPRIDHQGHNSNYTFCESFEFSKDSPIFSSWLKKKLSKFYPKEITSEQLQNYRFMHELIQLKPEYIMHAEKSIKSGIFRSLKDFPAGLDNLDFAKSFISFHFSEEKLDQDIIRQFNLFASSTLSKKEFVLFLYDQILNFKKNFTDELSNLSFLNFLEKCEAFDEETKKYQQTAITLSIINDLCKTLTKKINPELYLDPEIQEKLNLITSKYRFNFLRSSEDYQNAHWPNGVPGW